MMEKETLQTYDINDVEIFESGKWNGDSYSDQDLDDIVAAFNEIGGKLKPYIKLGHDKGQALLQKDGYPSAGWITGLRRISGKLVADLKEVPEKIYKLIQSKAYGRISSEIYWNFKEDGKTYRRVLKAIALLGGDTPAVTSLDDFINLYTDNEYEKLILCTQKEDIMENDVKTYEIKINDLETKLKTYETEIGEKEKALAAADEKIKAFEAERVAVFSREVESFLDGAIKDGKMTPAQKEHMAKLCGSIESFESVKQFVANQGEIIPMGEKSEHREIEHGEDLSPDEAFDKAVMEYTKKNPDVSLREAMIAVKQEGGK
jgi:hypothetical protein